MFISIFFFERFFGPSNNRWGPPIQNKCYYTPCPDPIFHRWTHKTSCLIALKIILTYGKGKQLQPKIKKLIVWFKRNLKKDFVFLFGKIEMIKQEIFWDPEIIFEILGVNKSLFGSCLRFFAKIGKISSQFFCESSKWSFDFGRVIAFRFHKSCHFTLNTINKNQFTKTNVFWNLLLQHDAGCVSIESQTYIFQTSLFWQHKPN